MPGMHAGLTVGMMRVRGGPPSPPVSLSRSHSLSLSALSPRDMCRACRAANGSASSSAEPSNHFMLDRYTRYPTLHTYWTGVSRRHLLLGPGGEAKNTFISPAFVRHVTARFIILSHFISLLAYIGKTRLSSWQSRWCRKRRYLLGKV